MDNETRHIEQRTTQQNRALHKLFNDISAYCIETGLDQKAISNALKGYSVPTSPQAVKEVWRSMQIALTGKTSTKDLSKAEIDQVYDTFNKFWSELTGEYFAFPSIDALLLNQLDQEKYQ